MTDFGVTPQGFVLKTLQDILAEIERDQLANISPLLDVSADSPNGQNNGIIARALAELHEIAQVAYNGFDRDKAEDDSLISLAKLTGTVKRGATFSRVKCTLVFDQATLLESGTHFAHLDGNPDVRFTPEADFAAPAAGTFADVIWRAENTGPVSAPAHTLTVIATAVVGWDSIDNPLDASLGAPADTSETLRLRIEEDLAATGSSTVDAIRADVLQAKDSLGSEFVQSCVVFENTGDGTDANGLPPHSFEVLVFDGDSPSPTQNDIIAQVIWNGKPAGIRPFGSQTGNAVDDLGVTQIVSFSRVVEQQVYLAYDLVTGTGYAGDAAAKVFIADQANAAFNAADEDVLYTRLVGIPYAITGVIRVVTMTLGFAPSPTLSNDLPIGVRELARFDTTRIDIT